MEKVRVLHVLNSLGAGGIETFIVNIFKNINTEVIQFDFLIQSSEKQFYEDDIVNLGGNIYRVKPRSISIKQNLKELNLFFKENASQYKTVHFHVSSLSDISAMIFAKKYKIRNRIIHSHNVKAGGSKIHTLIHKVNKIFLRSLGTEFFACSLDAAKWMFTDSIINEKRFKIVNNAIDVDRFTYSQEDRILIRKELKIDDKSAVLGHVGRFHPQKNHEFLIQVFKQFTCINPDSYLILVGSGALQGKIKDLVQELMLTDRVIFLGLRKDTNKLLSAMDCFVFPSLYEGLGIVLIEAQANGVPIVASNDNIPVEVRINDNFLFTSLKDDQESWSNDVNRMVDLGRVCSKEAIVTAGYDLVIVSKSLENLYVKFDGII